MSQVMLQGNCPVRWLFEFHNSMLIMRPVMLRHCIEKTTEGSWEQNHVWQLPASQIHRAATLVQVTTWTNPNVWTVFTAGHSHLPSCFRGSSGQSLTAAQALSLQTVTREMNKLLFPGSRKQASLLAVFVQLHPFPAYVNINLHVVHCCTHFSSQWKSASQVCFIYNKELWLVMLVHRQLLPFFELKYFFLLPVFHSLICRLYFPWRLSHSPSDVDELWYSMLSHIHSGFLSARWRPYLHSHHTKCLQVGGILLVIPVSVKAVVCRTVETRRASIENSHLNINPTCSFQATLTTLQRSLARCVSGSSATFNRLS